MKTGVYIIASVALLLQCSCQAELHTMESPDAREMIGTTPLASTDTAVLSELRSELDRVLLSIDRVIASGPPHSADDQPELQFIEGKLSWYYANTGDYDQNGEVNAADLVPLAQHFGTQGPFAFNSLAAVVDGDRNTLINLADVTPIGVNFGNLVEGYRIYYSSNVDDYPLDVGDGNGSGSQLLGSVGQQPAMGQRKLLSFEFESVNPGFYWVRPHSGNMEGIASKLFEIKPPQKGNLPPVAILLAASQHVEANTTIELDGSMSSDPDGTALRYDWDLNGDGVFELLGSTERIEASWPWESVGTQTVSLRVLDIEGKLDIASIEMVIHPSKPGFFHATDGEYPDKVLGTCYLFHPISSLLVEYHTEQNQQWQELMRIPADVGKFTHSLTSPQGKELPYSEFIFYRVRTELNGLECLGYSNEDSGYCGIPKVHGLKAWNQVSPELIEVSWNKLSEADGYLVEYRNVSGGDPEEWSYLLETTLGITGFIHTGSYPAGRGAVIGEDYEYRVKARLLANYSLEWSITAIGRRGIKSVDAVYASDNYPDGIQLGWTKVNNAQTYSIEFRNAQGGQPAGWTPLATVPADDYPGFWHREDSPAGVGAQPGVLYEYRISSVYFDYTNPFWSNTDTGIRSDAWITSRHDVRRTARSSYVVPDNAKLLWVREYGRQYMLAPVINNDNLLIVGEDALYGLDSQGNQLWKGQGGFLGPPAISAVGTIATIDGEQIRITLPNGEILDWERYHPILTYYAKSPLFGPDLTLYIANFGRVSSYHNSPFEDWDFLLEVPSDPVLSSDGTVVFGAGGQSPAGWLVAIANDGSKMWETQFESIPFNICITDNGDLIAGELELHRLDMDGNELWATRTWDDPWHGVRGIALADSGNIYCIASELYCFNESGTELWRTDSASVELSSGIAVDGQGTIFVGDIAGVLHAFNPDGSERWNLNLGGEQVRDISIGPDGHIYLRAESGNLLALGSP